MKWCLKTKNGIELIEPNNNLANAYILKAEESLETAHLAKSRDWKISATYYTLYFSLYALLMKIGVKCEIHTCTITFARGFLSGCFNPEQLRLLEDALEARITAQYYVNRNIDESVYEAMTKQAPLFLARCKDLLLRMDEKKICQIQKELEKLRASG